MIFSDWPNIFNLTVNHILYYHYTFYTSFIEHFTPFESYILHNV